MKGGDRRMVDLDEMVRDLLGEKKEEREEKKEETVEEVLGEQQEQQVEQIGAGAVEKVEERVSSEREQILEQRTLNIGGYDIELDESEQKLVFLIAGEKGAGKTTLAFAFDGVKLCIPFDTKSFVVKRTLYNNDNNIIIASCLKYLANAVVFEQITEASARFYDCIVKLLEHILQNNSEFQGRKIDWVILDNFENFSRIAEYTARFHNKLQVFDTPQKDIFFKIWGERNWYIRNIFNLTYHIARKGVIYTVYLT